MSVFEIAEGHPRFFVIDDIEADAARIGRSVRLGGRSVVTDEAETGAVQTEGRPLQLVAAFLWKVFVKPSVFRQDQSAGLAVRQGEGQSVCKIFRGVFVQPQLLYLLREGLKSSVFRQDGEDEKTKKKCDKNRKAGAFHGKFLRWFGFYAVNEQRMEKPAGEGNFLYNGWKENDDNCGSVGKQRAEHTAVRAALIFCPEESPLQAAEYSNSAGKNPSPGE